MNLHDLATVASLAAQAAVAVCAGCAVITAKFPAPQSGPGAVVWKWLNWGALNVGHAKNAVAEIDALTK